MKIKSLTIYGYGKWTDTTFDLSSDFHVIYGENEAGKSTLMSFIHSILFGFPTRHSALLRYEPKDSSRYGGKLVIEDERFGEVSIERVHGKSTGDVKVVLEDGASGSEELLHTIVYGIDRSLYQSVFSFHLKGIERVEEMTKEQLNRYFLSAGALGTEQFLQRADQFKQQANQLYKPTGRVPKINQALKQLNEKQKAMEKAKKKNVQYLSLLQKADQLQQSISQEEQQQDKVQKKMDQLNQLEKNWAAVEEIKLLEKEISQLNTSKLSENGLYELNHLNQQIEEIRTDIHGLQDTLKEFEKEYEPSRELLLYQEHEKSIDALAVQIESINDMIREKLYIEKEADRLSQEMLKIKNQENLDVNSTFSKPLTNSELEHILGWQQEWMTCETELQQMEEDLSKINYRILTIEETIDHLEQGLWSNEVFRKEEEHFEKQKVKRQSLPSITLEMSLTISLTVILIAAWVSGLSIVFWIYGAGMLAILTSIVSIGIKKHKSIKQDQGYVSYETYIEQKETRKQWRQHLFNIDKLEDEKRSVQSKHTALSNQKKLLTEKWEAVKENKNIPQTISLIEISAFENKMKDVRKSERTLNKLQASAAELKEAIFLKTEQFDQLSEVVSQNLTPEQKVERFREFYSAVKEEKNQLQQYVLDSQEIRRKLNQLFETEKSILLKKQQLLKEAGADSEEVFRHLYGIFKQKNEKQEKLKVLKEQVPIDSAVQNLSSKELIQQEKTAQIKKAEKHKQLIKEWMEQKIELEVHIRNLEEGGEYTALLQDFENEKSRLQELVNDWTVKQLASYMIEKTLKYARKDRFPDTLIDAERYFSYLTDGTYKKIVIDEESVYVLKNDGNYFKADELSRGTAEPLYVSLRLAFIKNIQEIIRMPILIDDGFVNLDGNRRAKMYNLLKEISRTTQVVYFSFDRRSYEQLEETQITCLTK